MSDIYKNVIKGEKWKEFKASEISELKEEEEYYFYNFSFTLLLTFIWLSIFISFIIWDNKITIFLLSISTIAEIFFLWLTRNSKKYYMETINKLLKKYE